jgi:D-tagatose-1,6-bisphosphate aldolase subunit GatZ/KbaZ
MVWIQETIRAHQAGEPVGVFSVCCAQEQVLRAAMRVALSHDAPLLIECTSNQVNPMGGYTGLTPEAFRDRVWALADSVGFPRVRLSLGGDHLGPHVWQHLGAEPAMVHAEGMVAAYVAAGFEKIHLDCSMRCADDPPVLSDELMAARAARLCQVAEQVARVLQRPMPLYVVGTEVPVPGGETGEGAEAAALKVTRASAAQRTLDVHRQAFEAKGLGAAWSRVLALVVQPGVDFDATRVFDYRHDAAAALTAMAADRMPGMVFEAHSTDYQSPGALSELVRDHFAILKVGPALSFALREALFALSAIEAQLWPASQCIDVPALLDEQMCLKPGHWQAHYPGSPAEQALLRRYGLSDRCRYYWGEPAVAKAIDALCARLDERGIPGPLLSQFMPAQHQAWRAGALRLSCTDLIDHHIALALQPYLLACGHRAPRQGGLIAPHPQTAAPIDSTRLQTA